MTRFAVGLILGLAAPTVWGAAPIVNGDFCEVTSHSTIRCHWTTNIPASTRIKFRTSSGSYGSCPNRSGCWERLTGDLRTHSFSISNLEPSTAYSLRVCSTSGSEETCSPEKTLTTQARPAV